MVVDDQEANVRLLEGILRRNGLEHVTALTDPRRALELFPEVRPDLLLLDLHMPHMDGFEMLERLRELRDGDGYLPILVLTADVDPAARQRALGMGAEDFLTKPFDAAEVVVRARNLLETRFLYRELERRNIQLTAEVAERSDEAREAVAARSALLASLNRLQPGASLEHTAHAICSEFARTDGFRSVAFIAFGPDGSAEVVATAGTDIRAAETIEPIDPDRRRDLRERAERAPWATIVRARSGGKDTTVRESRWFAPVRSDDDVLGVLVAAGPELPASALQERLELLAEYASVARALLVPALAVRRHESARRFGLEEVIRERAFAPVFQPIVSIASGDVIGFEALTRFTDRTPPDARFADAARVGLGLELELATLCAAVEAARRLPAERFVSLNVSPALVADGRLGVILADLDRDRVLEITEHVEITDYEVIRSQIERLGDRTRLAIDDAGAGFASLRHILELHPDFVKLDRALVHAIETDPSRQALVVGMRYFSETTSCALLAEGVESAAERDALRELGVPFGQGYFFGRPTPVDQVGT